MDILIEIRGAVSFFGETIKTFFKQTPIKNGNVYSFPYKEFQVDLILIESDIFDVALDYFSYNDLGNLVGRIAHSFGLKYGHNGLTYVIREYTIGVSDDKDSQVLSEVMLSKSTEEIYMFLGLDYNIFQNGFDDLEDIFKFVSTSPYFNAKSYEYDELNHINRVRNKKRTSYSSFLKWIELHKDILPFKETKQNKLQFIPLIIKEFPHFGKALEDVKVQYNEQKLIKERFNGHLVKEWMLETFEKELNGKDLGMVMSRFKNTFGSWEGKFEEFILTNELDQVKKKFLDFYKMVVI